MITITYGNEDAPIRITATEFDTNDNGNADPGESLENLGIANASVRFARFEPATDSWEVLPAIDPGGWGGDSFSAGNFNRPLFCAGGFLYYYQMRAGPNRCVLHRARPYDGNAPRVMHHTRIAGDPATESGVA